MGATVFYLLMLQKIHQFKANNSDRKKYPLCLEYISKDFLDINAIKTGVNGYVYVLVLIITLLQLMIY